VGCRLLGFAVLECSKTQDIKGEFSGNSSKNLGKLMLCNMEMQLKKNGSNQPLGSPSGNDKKHDFFTRGLSGLGLAKCIRIHHDPIRVMLCFSNACGCCF